MKKKLKILVTIFFIVILGFITFIMYETKDQINSKSTGFAVSVFSKDSVLFQNYNWGNFIKSSRDEFMEFSG